LLSIALQPGTKVLNLCNRRAEDGAILGRYSDIFSQVWKKKTVHLKPGREVLFEKLTVTYLLTKFPASCGTEILHHVHKSLTLDPNLTQLNPVHSHTLLVFKTHSDTLFPYTPSSRLISFFPSSYLIKIL
jgi:hypothetical protein